ncbi:unnamed protein product [Mytilus coruscus]|uniref:Uncharacterized protein n=1 Tax=Mytilus coruscus TaxID=42192 RepID=A0A6J8D8M6_MYTCO|nr:unnamed protein product [Mytilus coruscus]
MYIIRDYVIFFSSEDPIVLSSSSDCYSDTSTSSAPTIDPVVINKLKKLKDEVDRLKAEESDTDSDVTLYFGDEDNFKGPPSRKRKSSDYTCTHVQQGTQTKISTLQSLRRQNKQILALKDVQIDSLVQFIKTFVILLVAGSRALGIISKIITGPLWRNIECKTHILDINDTLTALRSFLAEAKDDCSEVVTGKHLPFPEESCKIENDIVMAELFKPDETDVMTIQVLQALFSCMLNLLDRQAADHLPGNEVYQCRFDLQTDVVNELNCQIPLQELKYKRGTAFYEILN